MAGPENQPVSQVKQVSRSDVDERLAALIGNAAAVAAVASAVEGTLGPKGLNCMLVDRFGDVTITNDGSTILEKIDVNHPASRLLIQVAKAQDREIGDGTTTATVLASALISAGVDRVRQGVPVTKVLEGMKTGMATALEALHKCVRPVQGIDDQFLRRAALIAGREDALIADLALGAAAAFPMEKLLHDPAFRLADNALAKEGASSEVVTGLIIDKQPLNRQMPSKLTPATILLVDDALEPEQVEEEALRTEAGFQRYMQLQNDFAEEISSLTSLGANVIFVRKGVAESAEEALTEAGILVVRRMMAKDMARIAEHTKARIIKRSGLRKPPRELRECFGQAESVVYDEKLEHLRVTGGAGEPAATILVGAATREVREERQRIAQDAAAAVQAALRGGILPGGGAGEIGAMRAVQRVRAEVSGMAAYGLDCVAEALKRPLAQIVANAGFNPLEKVEEVSARQTSEDSALYGVNCDTGEVQDMMAAGVVDPALVKFHALEAAAEIAEAILRINTVIRKRDSQPQPGPEQV